MHSGCTPVSTIRILPDEAVYLAEAEAHYILLAFGVGHSEKLKMSSRCAARRQKEHIKHSVHFGLAAEKMTKSLRCMYLYLYAPSDWQGLVSSYTLGT